MTCVIGSIDIPTLNSLLIFKSSKLILLSSKKIPIYLIFDVLKYDRYFGFKRNVEYHEGCFIVFYVMFFDNFPFHYHKYIFGNLLWNLKNILCEIILNQLLYFILNEVICFILFWKKLYIYKMVSFVWLKCWLWRISLLKFLILFSFWSISWKVGE